MQAIERRMKIYKQNSEPILEFFQADTRTQVFDFEPKRGVDDFPKVKELLADILY